MTSRPVLNIEIAGRNDDAPDLALIHGWGIGKAVWQPVADLLTQDFRLHLVDLPGYGASADHGAGFEETARQLLDALPADATLCGWSLGSQLALLAARFAPERVGRLILVGASPSFTQRDGWPQAQPPALLQSFSEAIAADAKATLQRFVALFNQGDTQARTLGRMIVKEVLGGTIPPTDTLLTGLDWLRDVDLRERLPQIATPALLIHGEHDPLMPLAAARWLADNLPEATLEIFPGVAHAPFLNQPERFARLIGDFCHAPAPH